MEKKSLRFMENNWHINRCFSGSGIVRMLKGTAVRPE